MKSLSLKQKSEGPIPSLGTMKIIDNYRNEVGDKHTTAPNPPQKHEARLVNFFKKTGVKSIEYNGYKYFTRKGMVNGPVRMTFERLPERRIDLYRIKRWSDGKYATINSGKWNWTDKKEEMFTCDSHDFNLHIYDNINRKDIFAEHVDDYRGNSEDCS